MPLTKENIIEFVRKELTENSEAHKAGFDLNQITVEKAGTSLTALDAAQVALFKEAFSSEELKEFRAQLLTLKVGNHLESSPHVLQTIATGFYAPGTEYNPIIEAKKLWVYNTERMPTFITNPNIILPVDTVNCEHENVKLLQTFYQKLLAESSDVITLEHLRDIIESIAPSELAPIYTSFRIFATNYLKKINWGLLTDKKIICGAGAASSEPISINDALRTLEKSLSIEDKFFSYKAAEGLFFNIVRITESNYDKWADFSDKIVASSRAVDTKGAGMISDMIWPYKEFGRATFMAYVAERPITDPTIIDKSSIEMVVTVTTSAHAPCSKHMGISRVFSYPKEKWHPNIANKLHAFAAKFIKDNLPDKLFMLTSPTNIMGNIILEGFDEAGLSAKYYIHATKPFTEDTREKLLGKLDVIKTDIEELVKKASSEEDWEIIRGRKNIYSKNKINLRFLDQQIDPDHKQIKLSLVPGISEIEPSAVIIKCNDKELIISHAELFSREFSWIKDELRCCGCTNDAHDIAVELEALGSLGGFEGDFAA